MNQSQHLPKRLSKQSDKHTLSISNIRNSKPLEIGEGFSAHSFRESDFLGAMDPLVMVDHYTMAVPTFGEHPHAGLSAVSLIFESSAGRLHNRDSLGNDFDLMPGDLYWLKAGSGVIHDEAPRSGSTIHGLQIFVNLPASLRHSKPDSLHVKAKDMPIVEKNGARVRIALGESNDIKGKAAPALPMTILDGTLQPGSEYTHHAKPDRNIWLYAIEGELNFKAGKYQKRLLANQSIAISNRSDSKGLTIELTNSSQSKTQFALFVSKPIGEPFVTRGPFVMSTESEIEQIQSDYESGKLGVLS